MGLPDREAAWTLVQEWITSDSLRKHVLAVEAAVRAYARHFGEDEEFWGVTALLHDLDFERFPDMDDQVNGHPRTALRMFKEWGYPDEMIEAVAGHAPFLGIPRTVEARLRPLRKRRADRPDHGRRLRPAQQRPPRRRSQLGQEEVEGQAVRGRR